MTFREFNSSFDVKKLVTFGRISLWRAAFPTASRAEYKYGLAVAQTGDVFTMTADEIRVLADVLNALIAADRVKDGYSRADFDRLVQAQQAAKPRRTPLW